jgi:beta-glucosidase
VATGDPTATAGAGAPAEAGEDIDALVADPVLVAARAEAVAPAPPPPAVWGLLDAEPDPGAEPAGDVDTRARALLDAMTEHEKLHLLSGDVAARRGLTDMWRGRDERPYVAGEVQRLGVPGLRYLDGAGGVDAPGATVLPVPMARAATFDPALEARVGDAVGVECRALGANLFAGVCADLLRHPAAGRAHETYGEDPHLVGELAAALVRGTQRHVMACVKHLVGASVEDGRYRLDVHIDEDDLRAQHLPPFRRCVDAGVAAVMTAYHRLDGERCGHHHHLLTEILKDEWGFDGVVVSGLVLGVRSAGAVAAGMDVEMPYRWRFSRLGRQARWGRVPGERVDDAALRVLRRQVWFADRTGRAGEPDRYTPAAPAGDVHRGLAREVAERSLVLLRNEKVRIGPAAGAPVLPLDPEGVESMAVLGPLADVALTGEPGPRPAGAPPVVTLLDGLRAAADRWVINVEHHRGGDLDGARLAAAAADVAVVVAGVPFRDAGERPFRRARDRQVLTLPPEEEALIRTVAAANPRTVVVLVGGAPIVAESWREQAGAILMAWYPGMEGGHAVARALFGEANPGGRLPCTWPRAAEQLPPLAGGRVVRVGALHGYRLMEATGRSPAYPFGYGLSYSTFEHGRITAVEGGDGSVRITVPVVNTGTRPGDEVVQVYLDEALGSDPRPLRTLRAFRRVTVAPGMVTNVVIDLTRDHLARTAAATGGAVRVHVGRSADPADHRTLKL